MISCGDGPRTARGLLAITLDGWTGWAPASKAFPRIARGMTAEASAEEGGKGVILLRDAKPGQPGGGK